MKPICLPMIEPVHPPNHWSRQPLISMRYDYTPFVGAHSHTRPADQYWDDYSVAGMAHVTAHAEAHSWRPIETDRKGTQGWV